MKRKITLTTPKLSADGNSQIIGADLAYCYFDPGALRVYMNDGALCETIPLEGMEPADRQLAADFADMLARVTGVEIETAPAKGRVREAEEAREAARQEEERAAEAARERPAP